MEKLVPAFTMVKWINQYFRKGRRLDNTNILYSMDESLIRYCKVISQIIEMPVSISDDRNTRLAYFGKQKFYSLNHYGHITKKAVETGETQVMLQPHGHPACEKCAVKEECPDKVSIIVPIKVNQRCQGIIAIFAQTVRLEKKVRANKEFYTAFLEQIAELISYEAMQKIEFRNKEALVELLETVFKRVNSGILVLDADNRLSRINKEGEHILRNVLPDFERETIHIEETEEIREGFREYLLTCQSQVCILPGDMYIVNTGEFHKVFIFHNRQYLKKTAEHGSYYKQIVGTSEKIDEVRKQVKKAAVSRSGVLIQAEAGLPKELYAKAIHDESDRWDKPFVCIDCLDLQESDCYDYLFGTAPRFNEAGSRGKPGMIENAAGGTLYLDNIYAMPLPLQHKIAVLIEKKELTRVGSKKKKRVDLRVIAASNKDLKELCREGRFLTELFYLLSVIPIYIPALHERSGDIRLLAMQSVRRASRRLGVDIKEITEEFWDCVENYRWTGNVQELNNAMEYAVNMADFSGALTADLLPGNLRPPGKMYGKQEIADFNLKKMERTYFQRALEYSEENGLTNSETAALLGISKRTFYRKLEQLNL